MINLEYDIIFYPLSDSESARQQIHVLVLSLTVVTALSGGLGVFTNAPSLVFNKRMLTSKNKTIRQQK